MLLQKIILLNFILLVCGQPSMTSFYKNYLNQYNKHYNISEYNYRYPIFINNYNYINSQNKLNKTYSLGLNQFTDFSTIEFKNTFLNLKMPINNKNNIKWETHNDTRPNSIDWRAAGIVTDVKNQGQCGSCWAFSAIGTIEGQHAKNTGKLVSLSEQNLVDCSTDNFGCDGGWPYKAMEYVINNSGIDTEASYPYMEVDDSCEYNKTNNGATISYAYNVPSGNMSALYDTIGLVGPISIAIDAEYDFQFYKSGIYKSTECSCLQLDHAVLAVGYNSISNKSYIIVKNSWGTDWGMDGYIYMSTEIENMCGMATAASYPKV